MAHLLMQFKEWFLGLFRDKNDVAHALIGENISLLLILLLPFNWLLSAAITFVFGLIIEFVNEFFVDESPDIKDVYVTQIFSVVGIVLGCLLKFL